MNKKQNVLEICCYIVALILLFLYWNFGNSSKRVFNKEPVTIETPIVIERVQ